MTIQMIITLAIVIGMIVMIMSDKFAFGAPPLIACVLSGTDGLRHHVRGLCGLCGQKCHHDRRLYGGHGGVEKTSLIDKVKATMFNMASKGGYRNYILLLIVVMLVPA